MICSYIARDLVLDIVHIRNGFPGSGLPLGLRSFATFEDLRVFAPPRDPTQPPNAHRFPLDMGSFAHFLMEPRGA